MVAGAAFLAGLTSSSDEDSSDDSYLETFFAGAAFVATGAAFLTGFTGSSEEDSSDDSTTGAFLTGAAFVAGVDFVAGAAFLV